MSVSGGATLEINIGDFVNATFSLTSVKILGLEAGFVASIEAVQVSGGFSVGYVEVDDPSAPLGVKVAMYLDVYGSFFMSGVGGGIRLIVTSRGPIMASISGGFVEPQSGFTFTLKDGGFLFEARNSGCDRSGRTDYKSGL